MGKAEVFFSRQKDIAKLFDALKIDFIKENSFVALKIHFGEIGNNAYLKPENYYAFNDHPVVPDIGLLASYDPVAIDQASVDLVNEQSGSKDKFREIYPDIDWSVQLSYAESLGIGTRNYKLTEI